MPDLPAFPADRLLVAPSILAADFARLGEAVAQAAEAGAEITHLDVMDGHFVPNLTIGPAVVESIRPGVDTVFDAHLMVEQPQNFVEAFAAAGADNLTIHAEIDGGPEAALDLIHEHGCSAGLCLRPKTPAAAVEPFLDRVQMILVMTVEPGFGGQSFMADMLPKIRRVRELIDQAGVDVHVEVDGGIDDTTAPQVVAAGANVLVAGSSVFRAPAGVAAAVHGLRAACE